MSAHHTGGRNVGTPFSIFAKSPNIHRRLGDSIISVPPSLGASYSNIGATGSITGRTAPIQSIPPPIVGIALPGAAIGGNNLGSCVEVYDNTVDNTLNFRTLCAGSNVTIQQDVPSAGDILISATGGSSPSSPDNINLYVSALGSDSTGLGTLGEPYATIQYAAQQIRKTGYNITAAISVIDTSASSAFLQIQNTIVDLDTGPYGRQQYPLILQGVSSTGGLGRVTVKNDVVSATTPPPDSPSDVVYVTGVAGGYSAAQQGQILRFTSGSDVTNVPLPGIGPATLINIESFIGNVTTTSSPGDTLVLALTNSTAPATGDTFVVENLTTQIYLAGFVLFTSSKQATFYNLDISSTTNTFPVAVMGLLGLYTYLVGVRFHDSTSSPLIIVSQGSQGSTSTSYNIQPPASSPSTNSVLGIALLSANTNVVFNMAQGGEPSNLFYTVVISTGSGSVQVAAGNSTRIVSGYFTGLSSVTIPSGGSATIQEIFFDTTPAPPLLTNGSVDLSQIHFNNTSGSVCIAEVGSSLVFQSDILFSGCGTLVSASDAFVYAPEGIAVTSSYLVASLPMFTLSQGAFAEISTLTGPGGGAIPASVDVPLVTAADGSTFIVDDALIYAPTRAGGGTTVILSDKSTAQFSGGLTVSGGVGGGVELDTGSVSGGSYLGAFGSGLSVTDYGGSGIQLANGSTLVASTITSTGNSGTNIEINQATMLSDGNIVAGPGSVGLVLNQNSTISAGGTIAASGTTGTGITLTDSILTTAVGESVTVIGAGGTGIVLVNSQLLAGGSVTVTGCAVGGINMTASSLLLPNTSLGVLTLTGNTANGLNASSASIGGPTIGMSQIYAVVSIDCSGTLTSVFGDNNGIEIDNTVLTTGNLTANGCVGSGVVLLNGSRVHVGNLITANTNGVRGVVVSGAVSLACTGITASTNAGGALGNILSNILISGASNVQASTIVANTSTFGFGLWVQSSQLSCSGSITATGNAWDGMLSQASQVIVIGTGSFTGSVQGAGISIGYSQSGTAGSGTPITSTTVGGTVSFTGALTCTGNADYCIFVDNGTIEACAGTALSTATGLMIFVRNSANLSILGFGGAPITVSSSVGTANVMADLGSTVTFQSAALAGFIMTAVGLVAGHSSKITSTLVEIDWSGVTGGGTLITSDTGSYVCYTALYDTIGITGGPTPTANNLILCQHGSTILIQTANIVQVPIAITDASKGTILGTLVTCSAGAPSLTPLAAVVDCANGSTLTIDGGCEIIGSGTGVVAGQDGVRVEYGSQAYIGDTDISSATNNGLTVSYGSSATINAVTSLTTNGNFGAQLEWGSKLTGVAMVSGGAGALSGTAGQLQIGGKLAANTWASVHGTPPMTVLPPGPPGADDSSDWAVAAPNCQNCQVSIQS